LGLNIACQRQYQYDGNEISQFFIHETPPHK
jgi:hypothetical protein